MTVEERVSVLDVELSVPDAEGVVTVGASTDVVLTGRTVTVTVLDSGSPVVVAFMTGAVVIVAFETRDVVSADVMFEISEVIVTTGSVLEMLRDTDVMVGSIVVLKTPVTVVSKTPEVTVGILTVMLKNPVVVKFNDSETPVGSMTVVL